MNTPDRIREDSVARNVVVLVRRMGLGETGPADDGFGVEMLDRFFHSLEGQPERPATICFYTDGVRACCSGSPLIPGLKLLEGLGVRMVSCRTCLEKVGLADQVRVGEIGNMAQMAGLLLSADSVITV
jgi:hypothetical protein